MQPNQIFWLVGGVIVVALAIVILLAVKKVRDFSRQLFGTPSVSEGIARQREIRRLSGISRRFITTRRVKKQKTRYPPFLQRSPGRMPHGLLPFHNRSGSRQSGGLVTPKRGGSGNILNGCGFIKPKSRVTSKAAGAARWFFRARWSICFMSPAKTNCSEAAKNCSSRRSTTSASFMCRTQNSSPRPNKINRQGLPARTAVRRLKRSA